MKQKPTAFARASSVLDEIESVEQYAERLLRALNRMALGRPAQPLDLEAALLAAGLPRDSVFLREALRLLYERNCVAHFEPLTDGGLLLRLTGARATQSEGIWKVS